MRYSAFLSIHKYSPIWWEDIWADDVKTPEHSIDHSVGHVMLAGIMMTDDACPISQTAHGTSSSTATFLYVYRYSDPYKNPHSDLSSCWTWVGKSDGGGSGLWGRQGVLAPFLVD